MKGEIFVAPLPQVIPMSPAAVNSHLWGGIKLDFSEGRGEGGSFDDASGKMFLARVG